MSELKSCDLVMKGGITSGIVYSTAIPVIAENYRLKQIGGTSAGAIGAVIAGAAEYRRQTAPDAERMAGFIRTEELAAELGTKLKSLFQPPAKLERLFNAFTGVLESKGGRLSKAHAFLSGYGLRYYGLILGLLALPVSLILAFCLSLFWVKIALASLVLAIVCAILLYGAISKDISCLEDNDFGLCSGKTQSKHSQSAFSDWIAEQINEVAGKPQSEGPLTIGELRKHDIDVAAITSDLSSGRPFQLPLKLGSFYFSESEFKNLFPDWVLNYFIQHGEKADEEDMIGCDKQDLRKLPILDDMPVLLVVRLSLSFPLLISAVPLYRREFQEGKKPVFKRSLFSDGGISSNFPIHFFDSLLPSRPTFGISLGTINPKDPKVDERVRMRHATYSERQPVKEIRGLGGFFGAIFDTAANWQDTLQTQLAGYAERIVEIRLDPKKEGGLNLDMDKATIDLLGNYGREAGEKLIESFDARKHREIRAKSTMPALEAMLAGYANAYKKDEWQSEGWAEIFSSSEELNGVMHDFAKTLVKTGTAFDGKISDAFDEAKPDAKIRFVADADRTPKHAE